MSDGFRDWMCGCVHQKIFFGCVLYFSELFVSVSYSPLGQAEGTYNISIGDLKGRSRTVS